MKYFSHQTSVHRWRRLSRLLIAIERAVEGAARLDAYTKDNAGTHRRPRLISVAVCAQMDLIAARVDKEVDRCTAELLRVQLAEKIRRQKQNVAA